MQLGTHPLLVVAAVAVGMTLLGLILSYILTSSLMRGYREIAGDVEAIARKLRAQKFRDGDDLVLSGNLGKYPAIVRFSYADNTPGLNIQMKAPSTFKLAVSPKSAPSTEGRVAIRTGDDMFDARFVARTDQPTQARMFLTGRQATQQMQKLCCSSKTFLTFSNGSVELSELVIPQPYTAKHVSDHLDSFMALAGALGAMPGADTVKITPYKRERSVVARVALLVLLITGVLVVVDAIRQREQRRSNPVVVSIPVDTGILLKDQPLIPNAPFWRLAKEDDFDPAGVNWFRGQHAGKISGVLSGNFSGGDTSQENAYILIGTEGPTKGLRRVVVIANKKLLFDSGYPTIAVAAVVAHDNIAGITLLRGTAAPADGDGVLIVRDVNDMTSSLLIYSSNGKVATAIPANYQQVPVE